jgi:lysophospholipase L1-like esterase
VGGPALRPFEGLSIQYWQHHRVWFLPHYHRQTP